MKINLIHLVFLKNSLSSPGFSKLLVAFGQPSSQHSSKLDDNFSSRRRRGPSSILQGTHPFLLDQVEQIPPGRLRAWIGSIDHLTGVKAWKDRNAFLEERKKHARGVVWRMSDFCWASLCFCCPFFVDRKEDFFHGKIELEIVSIM